MEGGSRGRVGVEMTKGDSERDGRRRGGEMKG